MTPEDMQATQLWRDRYNAAASLRERSAVLTEAAIALGLTPRSLHDRWQRLGMTRDVSWLRRRVPELVKSQPFATDPELAVFLTIEAGRHIRAKSVQRIRSDLGLQPASHRRCQWLRREVMFYVEHCPAMGASHIHSRLVADGPPFSVSLTFVRDVLIQIRLQLSQSPADK